MRTASQLTRSKGAEVAHGRRPKPRTKTIRCRNTGPPKPRALMEVSNMDTLTVYRTPFGSVNSTVTGRYLAHNHLNRVGKAFLARDLSVGAKQMIEPTIFQAAMLARV